MKIKKVYFARVFTLLAVLYMAGCVTTKPKEESSDVLQERAVERWKFLIAHQAEKAYDYLSPGYRATKPRDVYAKEMNSRGMKWTNVVFSSKECDADACKVRVLVEYKIEMAGAVGPVKSMSPLVETWIKVDGKWYFLPDPVQSPKLGGSPQ